MELIPENKNLEYKKGEAKVPKEFWPTYSSFSNTDGGQIILGVTEEPKNYYTITGVEKPNKLVDTILNEVNNPQKVSFSSISEENIEIRTEQGKNIVIVTIPPAPQHKKPVYIHNIINNSYKRVRDADQRMSVEEITDLLSSSRTDIDSELIENFGIDDLSLSDVQDYRKLYEERSDIVTSSDVDFLKSIGAFRKNRKTGEYLPTIACLLFFGKYHAIVEKFPNLQLDYFRKQSISDDKWDDRVSSGDMNFPEMNLFSFYRLVSSKLFQTVDDKFIQNEQMERTSYVKDMKAAIRETLVNCLMHSHYKYDTSIKITAFDTFYEFSNPGQMLISKEDFLMGGHSKPRNPSISALFRGIGLAERAGYGGKKILQVAQKNDLKIPDVISELGSTTVSLWKIDFISTLPHLSEEAVKVLEYLKEHRVAKKKQLEALLGLSTPKTTKIIEELKENNLLKIRGKARATRYFINLPEEMRMSDNQKLLRKMELSLRKRI